MGFIYLITNTVNDKKYVGLTTKSVESRWQRHLYNAQHGIDYALYRSMRKYGIEKFKVEIVEEVQSITNLQQREMYWIDHYDSRLSGYNMTIGGEGNRQYSLDTIYALWDEGFSTGEIALKIGCMRGTIQSSLVNYIKYSKIESIQRRNQLLQKKVVQFDINGNYINEFESESIACNYIGCTVGQIGSCCNYDKHCTVKGYIWVWESDIDKVPSIVQELKTSRRRSTPDMQAVVQLDKSGQIVSIYESAKEAAKAFGKTRDIHIGECCKGKRKTCFGYYWMYLNDVQTMDR